MKDENPFKDKLFPYTIPVRDEVWQAIERKLPEKEDRRLPLFWFVLFASALIGGSLMFGYTKQVNSPLVPIQQDTSKIITIQPDVSGVDYQVNPATDIAAASTPTVVNTAADVVGAANETAAYGKIPQAETTTSGSITAAKSSQPQLKSNRVSNSTSTNNNTNYSNISNNNTNTNSTNNNNTSTNTSSRSTTANNKAKATGTNSLTSVTQTKATVISPSTSTTISTTPSTPTALPGDDANSAGSLVTPVSKRTTRITDLLPVLNEAPAETEEAWLADMLAIKPDPNCFKFSAKGGQYFFSTDFFSGPGWSPRTFTNGGGGESLYQTARKATESSLYAWSAGARFNMHLHNGFAIRLGILYDQAGDVFDYTDTLATRSTTRIDSFFSADGSFLYADTSRILIFGTLIKRINNTYRHLDVPILLSYEIPWGRSTFMINGGPVFNLTSTHKGQILDPMLIPRHITPGQPNLLSAYKTSLGLSIYLGAGVVFPLTHHFAGIIEPRYLYRIKPVTIKSYPLEERRHYAGLNIGLRYFFK